MIPASRWRRVAVLVVVVGDLVVLAAVGALLPGMLVAAAPLLAAATAWGLLRPGGWGGTSLVLSQVALVAVAGHAPETVADWVVAAAAAVAVCATHLALSLAAAWPVRAALPRATARRWLGQAAMLTWAAILAALLGILATGTPLRAGPWVVAGSLALVAGTAVQLRIASRRA